MSGLAAPALALSARDLPAAPPQDHVLDQAEVLSRASRGELSRRLAELQSERVEASLITISRLDYGLTLEGLGEQLLERWQDAKPAQSASALLLLLIDNQTKGSAVVASPALQRQLPQELLLSTASTTMALPLRQGDRYRQASLDAITRLDTVLRGGEDPGPPVEPEEIVPVSNIPTREETQSSNAFTWVIVLLVVGSVVPMVTWWIFSR
ncbi:MAG: TPM domain-containing protein [Synechococcaceae cyanobacterium]|nr:TPM domain-containing protein [Synechococcaceae cyanobacterium]